MRLQVPWRGPMAAGLAFLAGMFADAIPDFSGEGRVAVVLMMLFFGTLSAIVLFTRGRSTRADDGPRVETPSLGDKPRKSYCGDESCSCTTGPGVMCGTIRVRGKTGGEA